MWRAEELAWGGARAVGHREAIGRAPTEAEALAKAQLAWLGREARAAEGVR